VIMKKKKQRSDVKLLQVLSIWESPVRLGALCILSGEGSAVSAVLLIRRVYAIRHNFGTLTDLCPFFLVI